MSFHSSNRQEAVSERLQNVQCICRRQCVSPIQCKRCDFLRLIMSSKVATCTTGDGHSSEDHTELLMARSVIDSSTKVPCCHDEKPSCMNARPISMDQTARMRVHVTGRMLLSSESDSRALWAPVSAAAKSMVLNSEPFKEWPWLAPSRTRLGGSNAKQVGHVL